jgi:hypothetical protein
VGTVRESVLEDGGVCAVTGGRLQITEVEKRKDENKMGTDRQTGGVKLGGWMPGPCHASLWIRFKTLDFTLQTIGSHQEPSNGGILW